MGRQLEDDESNGGHFTEPKTTDLSRDRNLKVCQRAASGPKNMTVRLRMMIPLMTISSRHRPAEEVGHT